MVNVLAVWHNLPWIIKIPLDFILYVIIVRGIIASDITTWLKDKGFIQEGRKSLLYKIMDRTYNTIMSIKDLLRKTIINTDRKEVFWMHETEGHNKSLKVCTEGNCQQLDTL